MALVERNIDVTFALGTGSFGDSGSNETTLTGLRVSTKIVLAGGMAMGQLQMQVYGMTFDMMNKLSTLGLAVQLQRRNSVSVMAGDADSGMSLVFVGTIQNAWADFSGSPENAFQVEASVGLYNAVVPQAPTSYNGATNAVLILQRLATQAGLAFENNGVSSILVDPYFYGSLRSQMAACVEAANIDWNGGENATLAIWPKGKARYGSIPLISPATGLIGYPAYTSQGIVLQTLFNPNIAFGGKVKVESSLTPANGEWNVFRMDHDLESQVPGGSWFSTVNAYNPTNAAPQIPT